MRTGIRAWPVPAGLALAAALAGCGGEPSPAAAVESSPAAAVQLAEASRQCHVTKPDRNAPYAEEGFNYGNESLGVVLFPRGRLVAGRLPDGSYQAEINPDGSITAKVGWWRAVEGRLRVRGKRLDRRSRRLRADIPDGYPPTGFQPTGLTFPKTGCWKVTGRVGDARLSFVVKVTKTAGSS
jgi:hypothetical protein